MIELLQNLQLAIGPFVLPVVIALSGLLLLITIIYSAAVFHHWRSRKTREDLEQKWLNSSEEVITDPGSDNLQQTQLPPYERRDDFLNVLRIRNLASDKTVEIYRRKGFYKQDISDLSHRAWWRRAQALHRLKYVSLAGLQDEVTSLIYDSSREVKLAALYSLIYLEEFPDLNPIKFFENFNEKQDSFLVIKLLPLKPDKSFLRPLVDSKKPRLRRAGATLLGQPNEPKFLHFLSKLTKDKDKEVRKRVAESLGRVGSLEALPILERTSEDNEPTVRAASARSLGRITHEDSVEILDHLATDDTFKVRLAAFNSLSHFGEEGRKAIGNHWSENRRLAREAIFESYQKPVTP
ncbi:HEAT repeat domain-containing protein [Candidatus Bipolaricaulota bacterium]|nr:HEAT repeat domain-containing protein [Candidatus Bipolaricaulota bacterium]